MKLVPRLPLNSPRTRPNTPPGPVGRGQDDSYDRVIKVVACGSAGVGKTSLITRATDDTFSSHTASTVGVEFKFHNVVTKSGVRTKCQVWDTAGQERFAQVHKAFYRGCNAILFVFDLTDVKSFQDIQNRFFKEASWERLEPDSNHTCAVSRYTCGFLVGNKSDVPTKKREVMKEHAAIVAREYDLIYVESSAKTGSNVRDIFVQLAELLEQANTQLENEVGESLYVPTGNFETIRIEAPIITPRRSEGDESLSKKSSCCS